MRMLLNQPLWTKLLVLGALLVVLMIPLSRIDGLIHERGALQQQARGDLAAAHAGPQVLAGPLLAVPYVERWTETVGEGQARTQAARSRQGLHLVFPQRLELAGRVAPQERYRGIFTVLFYRLDGRFQGQFAPFDPASMPRRVKDSQLELQPPVLVLAPSDLRGIQGMPALQLAESPAAFAPGVPGAADDSWLARAVHAPLPPAALAAWRAQRPLPFALQLALIGQERLALAPAADETLVTLESPWPHPAFGGQFLPAQRSVSASGFRADWAVSSLVSPARAQLAAAASAKGPLHEVHTLDVSLVQPVGVYTLTNRAIKYAALFIVLVLAAAFLFELLRGLRLHPVQYGLVGTSIALFFLLLLALSEKLAFGLAYGLAAGASVLLLTLYFGAVLGGVRRGLALGGYTAVLYGALFGLLRSEDNALLLGSLLLFGLLALLMLGTRRVDWYALGRAPSAAV